MVSPITLPRPGNHQRPARRGRPSWGGDSVAGPFDGLRGTSYNGVSVGDLADADRQATPARGSREPGQALTGAALTGATLCGGRLPFGIVAAPNFLAASCPAGVAISGLGCLVWAAWSGQAATDALVWTSRSGQTGLDKQVCWPRLQLLLLHELLRRVRLATFIGRRLLSPQRVHVGLVWKQDFLRRVERASTGGMSTAGAAGPSATRTSVVNASQ